MVGILSACLDPVILMAYFINLFTFMESSDCRLRSLVSTLQFSETPLNFCFSLVGTQFQDMPGSGRILMTCPGRYTVVRHSLVGRCFLTCTGRESVLRHALVMAQYYDIPGSVLIKSITYYILPCLRMFPQSTGVYSIRNCTNLPLEGVHFI